MAENRGPQPPRATAKRGPDFLPYALPGPPSPPPFGGSPPAGDATQAPYRTPVDPVKIAAAAAAVGVGAFLLVSLLGGLHWWGAGVAIAAAAVALVAGQRALSPNSRAANAPSAPANPRPAPVNARAARGAQIASAVAAVLALATALLAGGNQDAGSQALAPTSDLPSPPQLSTPDPGLPPPDPAVPSFPATPPSFPAAPQIPQPPQLSPAPQLPGSPLSQDPTAKGTLTGRVVDAGGAPLPGATVTLTRSTPGDTSDAPACPLTVRTTTNAQGIYTIKLCQLGDNLGYTARIGAGGHFASADLFINAGRTTRFSVQLDVPPTKHS